MNKSIIYKEDKDIREDLRKLEALQQEPKTDTWSIKDVADTLAKHGLIAEQEPCEDAVSRQAVIDCFKKWQPYMATRLHEFEKELFSLPSVNPQKLKTDVLDKLDEIITDALDNSTDQKESQTLRWVLDKISEVT